MLYGNYLFIFFPQNRHINNILNILTIFCIRSGTNLQLQLMEYCEIWSRNNKETNLRVMLII